MAGNSFGQAFRITTAGESHGPGNVVIVDGCPPGIPLSVPDLLVDLDRRKPGQSKIVTQRKESDTPEILAGVFEGVCVRERAVLAPGVMLTGSTVIYDLVHDREWRGEVPAGALRGWLTRRRTRGWPTPSS